MCEEEKHSVITVIVEFLTEIGLSVEYTLLDDKTFLSGINIEDGRLYIDREKLLYPGELLYNAGKIAVAPPVDRAQLNNKFVHESCDEMMVIAWCWAASKHLNLSFDMIFYANSYSCSPRDTIETFSSGRFFGVPLLQWAGMTNEPTRDLNGDMVVFPEMIKWLRN